MLGSRQWLFTLALVVGLLAQVPAARAGNGPPPDTLVKQTSEEVLNIIRNDKEIRAGNTARVMKLIEDKVAPHFDFARMTRLAVGRSWREAAPEQRDALTREFRALLVKSYAAAFSAFGIAVDYKPLKMNPGDVEAVVQTIIRLPGGAQPLTVDYDMADSPDGWKVYDVRVGGASLIINYRNLFAQEIQNGGLDGLIKSLVDKNSGKPAPAAKQ